LAGAALGALAEAAGFAPAAGFEAAGFAADGAGAFAEGVVVVVVVVVSSCATGASHRCEMLSMGPETLSPFFCDLKRSKASVDGTAVWSDFFLISCVIATTSLTVRDPPVLSLMNCAMSRQRAPVPPGNFAVACASKASSSSVHADPLDSNLSACGGSSCFG